MYRIVMVMSLSFAFLLPEHVIANKAGRKHYPELGVTFSMLLQPSLGYWWGDYGVRINGMYLDKERHEFHFNLGRVIKERQGVQHSINLLTSRVVGNDRVADYNYSATGIAYAINYKGFFLELGLAVPWRDEIGNLDDDPVIPCGYWGYIHRFN